MSNKENNPNKSTVNLQEEMETLFKFAPPRQMKRSLMEIYTVYLQHIDNMNFREVAMDIYFLNKLLEKAEEVTGE